MITTLVIQQVVASQKERLLLLDTGLPRKLSGFEKLSSHAYIITGIRRCGKSTALQQINNAMQGESIYLNFEDPRLAGFDIADLNRLHELGKEINVKMYFFDEIQLVDQWEKFVRFRLDEGYRIFITGSNATMLSKELGSRLTGRHISKELFPFSYKEFTAFTKVEIGYKSTVKYMETGGFPEFVKTNQPEILMQAFNDIIIRDIAIRYNIKNTTLLKQMAVWLVTNIGKPISGNKLKNILGIKSSSTIMEYFSYLTDSYLFFFVPKFSYSNKVQLVNPKKVYCIDNGFIKYNSLSFSNDNGRLLENIVYLELRNFFVDVAYFNEGKECDFVVSDNNKNIFLFQVCYELNEDSTEREVSGLLRAMEYFNIKSSTIITANQKDSLFINNKTIDIQPFFEWTISLENY